MRIRGGGVGGGIVADTIYSSVRTILLKRWSCKFVWRVSIFRIRPHFMPIMVNVRMNEHPFIQSMVMNHQSTNQAEEGVY